MRRSRSKLILPALLAAVLAAGFLPAQARGKQGRSHTYQGRSQTYHSYRHGGHYRVAPPARGRVVRHHFHGGVYFNPYFGIDPFFFGWPYAYGYYDYCGYGYGYGCGYGPYSSGLGYGGGTQAEPGEALVIMDISPGRAHVLVDGTDVGKARHFDDAYSPLWIPPGKHVVEFQAHGYLPLRVSIDVKEGRYYKLSYNLIKGKAPKEEPKAESPPTGSY